MRANAGMELLSMLATPSKLGADFLGSWDFGLEAAEATYINIDTYINWIRYIN